MLMQSRKSKRPRKVSTTPQDVSGKRSRGHPVGSTKKAKGKQTDVKDPSSFIHISVVKSHMSTANTSITKHIYDMVMVTISPHETTPPVVTKHASSEVSSQHVMVAGPSKEGRSISRTARLPMLSSLGPHNKTEPTSIFNDLLGQVHLLAEISKNNAKGLDDKVGISIFSHYWYLVNTYDCHDHHQIMKFFLNLRRAHKNDESGLSMAVLHIKKDKHIFVCHSFYSSFFFNSYSVIDRIRSYKTHHR